jgi:hypothetical protein
MNLKDLGLRNGINEVIGITFGDWINTAPLGIIIEDDRTRSAKVRLYSNHTRKNVSKKGELWFNIIHDPVIFAKCSFDDLGEEEFENFNPPIIKSAMAWGRFKAVLKGAYAHLTLEDGEILRKDLKAVNRGFNAVIEALVHATRLLSTKDEELREKVEYYLNIARKCGGERERTACEIIEGATGIK